MRKIFLFLLVAVLPCFVLAQSTNVKLIDSLTVAVKSEKDVNKKIDLYTKIALRYLSVDVKKAKEVNEEILDLYRKTNSDKALAAYHRTKMNFLSLLEDGDSIVYHGKIAVESYRKAKDTDNYILAINRLAQAYIAARKQAKAEALIIEGEKFIGKTNQFGRSNALLYLTRADLARMKGDLNVAIHYLQKALITFKKTKQPPGIMTCYNRMGSIYATSKDYKMALKYALLCLEMSKTLSVSPDNHIRMLKSVGKALHNLKKDDEALTYYDQALKISRKNNFGEMSGWIADEMSAIYFSKKDYPRCIAIIQTLLQFEDSYDIFYPAIYNRLRHSYFLLKQYDKANIYSVKFHEKMEEFNNEKSPPVLDEDVTTMYREVADTEAMMGNCKEAYDYYTKYATADKSALLKEKDTRVNELQAKFELTDKTLQLKDLTIKDQASKLKISDQRTTLFGVSGILAFVAVLSAMLWRNNRTNKKNNRLLNDKNHIISASLDEKELLLKEIHHRVKNNLQLVISLLSLQSSKFKSKKLNDFLESGTGRIVSMALIHENLYQTDNVASIKFRDYAQSLIETIIASMGDEQDITFSLEAEDIAFDIQNAIPLGLILNELVVNTIKHNYKSGNKLNFSVGLKEIDSKHEFTYKDPQSNMTEEDTKKSSFGLELVHLLAAQLDGKSRLSFTKGLTAKIVF